MFQRIELRSKLRCQGGTLLGVLYEDDLAAAKDIHAIEDTESFTFAFTRVDKASGQTRPIVSKLVARSIASVVWSDDTFDEWRVSLIDDSKGVDGLILVTANPLIQDLAEGADSSAGKGLVSTTANCLRTFSFTLQSISASDVWSTYVIPNCPSWVSAGTIDPTTLMPQLSWDRLTPQAVALLVRDTLRKLNVSCELQLRRNGTTDYKLDLITQIGSTAAVPLFHPRSNLASLKRRVDATQQTTRLFVTGETDPSGIAGIPGRGRWKVTNVDGVNKKLTLADPNGGAGPIGMNDQWINAYIARVLTGRTFQIQDSDASAQTVTLTDVSTFAANEMVEFRLTEPETNTRGIAATNTRFAITNVAGNNLTLSGNPITVDGEYIDWYVKVWTASSGGSVVGTPQRVSGSTALTDIVAIASASGFNNTQFVEFLQLDGAGEIPSYLEHATAIQAPPAGYGMKAGNLAVSSVLGVTNLMPNSWMRAWANPSNAPDGWSITTPTSASQNTNPSFTRYGGASYNVDFMAAGTLQTPRFDHLVAAGNTRISIRLQVFFSTFTGAGTLNTNFNFSITLWSLDASGAAAIQLAQTIVKPVDTNDTGFANKVAAGAWATVEIAGFDLPLYRSPFGMMLRIAAGGNGATAFCNAYIDAVEVYPFVANPDQVLEYGDAVALHQAGNRYLGKNGMPPILYELSIADAERAGLSATGLTLGGNVRAFNAELGVDTTVRLLRLERDLLRPKASVVGLSSLPAQLLTL